MELSEFKEYLIKLKSAGRLPNGFIIERHVAYNTLEIGQIYRILVCDNPYRDILMNNRPYCEKCDLYIKNEHVFLEKLNSQSGFIGIGEIRKLKLSLSHSALYGCKIAVFENAEHVSLEAYQALLKQLEEPHGDIIYVLHTVSREMLPATVRSRLQVFAITDQAEKTKTNDRERELTMNFKEGIAQLNKMENELSALETMRNIILSERDSCINLVRQGDASGAHRASEVINQHLNIYHQIMKKELTLKTGSEIILASPIISN